MSGRNLRKTAIETKDKWIPNGHLRIMLDGTIFDSSEKKSKPKKKTEPKDDSTKDTGYPDWLNKDLWNEYKQYREEIKKPLSDLAEEKMIKKLKSLIDKGQPQDEVLETAIASSWKGLYPVKKFSKEEQEEIDLPEPDLIVPMIERRRPKKKL